MNMPSPYVLCPLPHGQPLLFCLFDCMKRLPELLDEPLVIEPPSGLAFHRLGHLSAEAGEGHPMLLSEPMMQMTVTIVVFGMMWHAAWWM